MHIKNISYREELPFIEIFMHFIAENEFPEERSLYIQINSLEVSGFLHRQGPGHVTVLLYNHVINTL
jgi:hypothetical protein